MTTLKTKPILKIDWCTHEAAKYACENWHYSKCMPAGKTVKIGVWEDNKFTGVIIFSRGATSDIGSPYGLDQTEICELTRIALTKHKETVTRMVSIGLKMLKKQNPGVKLVVSYSDLNQNHIGGIYQGGNWIYVGKAKDAAGSLIINGKQVHGRSVSAKYGTRSLAFIKSKVDPNAKFADSEGKNKYLYPLDYNIKQQIEKLRKPYPKRASGVESGISEFHSEGGGESPTDALQFSNEVL